MQTKKSKAEAKETPSPCRQSPGWDRGTPPEPPPRLQLRAPRRRGSSETGGEARPPARPHPFSPFLLQDAFVSPRKRDCDGMESDALQRRSPHLARTQKHRVKGVLPLVSRSVWFVFYHRSYSYWLDKVTPLAKQTHTQTTPILLLNQNCQYGQTFTRCRRSPKGSESSAWAEDVNPGCSRAAQVPQVCCTLGGSGPPPHPEQGSSQPAARDAVPPWGRPQRASGQKLAERF